MRSQINMTVIPETVREDNNDEQQQQDQQGWVEENQAGVTGQVGCLLGATGGYRYFA